jgi:hypothetical protein
VHGVPSNAAVPSVAASRPERPPQAVDNSIELIRNEFR